MDWQTVERELWALLALAVPNIMSTYCFYAISMTELSVMGHVGVDELAAVAYSQMSMDLSTLTFFQGFLAGLNALCSQAFGASNYLLLHQYGKLAAMMLSAMCVPMAMLWWNLGSILALAGVADSVATLSSTYSRLWILAMWPRSIFQVLASFYQAQHVVLPTTTINCATVIINAMLAAGLTHGLFGLPKLGFIGCPLGTMIAMWLRLVCYHMYMARFDDGDVVNHARWGRITFKREAL